MTTINFSQTDVSLGSYQKVTSLVDTRGDGSFQHISWGLGLDDENPIAAVDFDYAFFSQIGFEIDLSVSVGDVDIVAPINVDLAADSFVSADGDITIDTSGWSWGDSALIASGPSYSLSVDVLFKLLLSTVFEKYQLLPDDSGGSLVESQFPNIPDVYIANESGGAIRQNLLNINSDEDLPLWSHAFGAINVSAAIPEQFSAISGDDDDYGADGQITADSVSSPFFSASMSFVDLAKQLGVPIVNLLSNTLEIPLPSSGNPSSFDYTLLDIGIEGNFRLAQEYVFNPGAVAVTITNTTTGESKQGFLGQTFDFDGASGGQDSDFAVSYDLGGSISSRWGIASDFHVPFTLLEATIENGFTGNTKSFGPFLEDEFNLGGFGPHYFVNGTPVDVNFATQTSQFSLSAPDPALAVIQSITSANGIEGTSLQFVVNLDKAATENVIIPFDVNSVTSESGDFSIGSTALTINAGETFGTITVQSLEDADTDDETFEITLKNPTGAVLGGNLVGTGTIQDPDTVQQPVIPVVTTLSDAVVSEGGDLIFTAYLNVPASQTTVINFSVSGGSASANDYGAANGQITIQQGAISGQGVISTVQDTTVEGNETVIVGLDSASGAALQGGVSGAGTIIDDDVAPPALPLVFAVKNDRVHEGDTLRFEIVLDSVPASDVTFQYQLSSITAEAGDYVGHPGTGTIAADSTSVFIEVPTFLDNDADDDTIKLEIVSVNGAVLGSDRDGTGTILDTYSPPPAQPRIISFSDATTTEGGTLSFNIGLDGPSLNDVVLNYRIVDLTSEITDYLTDSPQQLIIRKGSSSSVLEITSLHDGDFSDETLQVELLSAVGALSIDDTVATGTIIDDDIPQDVVARITSNGPVVEGSQTIFSFDLDNNPHHRTVTVFYHIDGITATEGVDFVNFINGQVDLSSDSITKTVRIQTIGDGVVEGNETLRLVVDRVEGGIVDNSEVIATILDDDDPSQGSPNVYFDVSSSQITEGGEARFNIRGDFANFTSDVLLEFKIVGENIDQSDIISITVKDLRPNHNGDLQFVENTFNNTTFATMILGQTSTQFAWRDMYVDVRFANDQVFEEDRHAHVQITVLSGNAQVPSYGENFSRLTILENDPAPAPIAKLFSSSGLEGDVVKLPVVLDKPAIDDITIAYNVTHIDTVNSDLVSLTGTVQINAGETVGFAEIATVEDVFDETDEGFSVQLTGVVAGTVQIGSSDTATGYVVNDDYQLFSEAADIVQLFVGQGDLNVNALGGNDLVIGTDFADIIDGGAGNDSLSGNLGNDTLYGGKGRDVLNGGEGIDRLRGNAGNDKLVAGNGDDDLRGGDDDDKLFGESGNDFLLGENGDDLLFGGTGNDNLSGNDGDDKVYGQDGNDVLRGNAGNDNLIGGDGNDYLYGGAGDDILKGRTGDDRMFGEAGSDIMFADEGNDQLFGGDDNDFLYGGRDGDTLYGQSGNDILRGNRDADQLFGGTGDDILRGGGGNDLLSGGSQNDFLFGENGQDVLNGGLGNDALSGGALADTFVFEDINSGFDRVKDFENGIDVLDLQTFGFVNFAAVAAISSSNDFGLRIDTGNGNVLFVEGFSLSEFDSSDVLI